jgi:MFS family permease
VDGMSTDEAAHGTEEAQRDRYRELLEELRTILPGVQVLFAFLLTAPFSNRFTELDDLGRDVYAFTLLASAIAVVLFMAPTSYHRIGPSGDRHRRLQIAIRLAIMGMAALAVAITSALFVITRFIYGTIEGVAVAAMVLVGIATLWYVLPWRRRVHER